MSSRQPSRLQTQEQVLPAGKGTLSSAKDFWTKSQAWHYSALSDALELWALPHQKYHRKLSTGSTWAVMKCIIIEFIFTFCGFQTYLQLFRPRELGQNKGPSRRFCFFIQVSVSPSTRSAILEN